MWGSIQRAPIYGHRLAITGSPDVWSCRVGNSFLAHQVDPKTGFCPTGKGHPPMQTFFLVGLQNRTDGFAEALPSVTLLGSVLKSQYFKKMSHREVHGRKWKIFFKEPAPSLGGPDWPTSFLAACFGIFVLWRTAYHLTCLFFQGPFFSPQWP